MTRRQKLIAAEAAAGFALIMLYIWRLRFIAPRCWVFILGFFILSHILRKCGAGDAFRAYRAVVALDGIGFGGAVGAGGAEASVRPKL